MREFENDPWPDRLAVAIAPITLSGGPEVDLTPLEELGQHPLLDSAVDKVRWSSRHLAALEDNIERAFADPLDCAVLRAEFDSESGYHIFSVCQIPDLTELSFGFTQAITDVANPLRAALDKFAWKAAGWFAGGTPPDPSRVKFPIASTEGEWENARRATKQFDAQHVAFIERYQPYHGASGRSDAYWGPYTHQLALLQKLTNDDKHRDTHPVLLVPGSFRLKGFNTAKRPHVFANGTLMVPDREFPGVGKTMELNTMVMKARLLGQPPLEVDDVGRCAPIMALPEGRVAVQTMQRLHRFVHGILSEFADHFPMT